MTLDTYTHLFEQARRTADVRAQLAKSEFAMALALAAERPRTRRSRQGRWLA